MIASIHGKLETLGTDCAVINVNGIGLRVYMPTSTLSTLGTINEDVRLHTHLILREDGASLYGFGTAEELELFQVLISVSGLGPRLGLAVLSAMSVEQASMAIASGSTDLLKTVSGIGKRMAERIVVELKDKISAGLVSAPVSEIGRDSADVLAALTSLGYSVAEASRAISNLPPDEHSLEEKITLALQYLGSK